MEAAFIEAYRALREGTQLTLRVAVAQEAESYGMPWSQTKEQDASSATARRWPQGLEPTTTCFRFLGLSFMRDGSCWPGTIRMREPYLGPTGS